jgi:hypothetical protein
MSTSRVQTTVLGFQAMEGTSTKTGKPYSIGKLFAMYPQVGKGVGGFMAAEISCEVSVLRKIEGLNFPCEVEVETANVMQWGKLQQQVVSLSPVGAAAVKKAA